MLAKRHAPDVVGRHRAAVQCPACWRVSLIMLAALGFLMSIVIATASASAAQGRITLADGTTMRGDITEREDEVILKNAAGEVRFPRDRVVSIEYDAPATQPTSAPSTRPGEPAASQPKFDGPEPPSLLSKRDILRLKLYEYPIDGEPQKVNVEFPRKRAVPTIEELVTRDVRAGIDLDDANWEQTLTRGRPAARLQLILKATGLKYADRIEIRGDTETFSTFRRRVLPAVQQGCTRSGCHGGASSAVWRLPAGLQSGDEFVYTSFYVLDQLQTAHGPMFDRAVPERSAILKYMLPADDPPAHPPVKNGKVTPVFTGIRDPDYVAVLEWINSLRVHVEYELDYQPPPWLRRVNNPGDEPATAPAQP